MTMDDINVTGSTSDPASSKIEKTFRVLGFIVSIFLLTPLLLGGESGNVDISGLLYFISK
jgi:hypothetical protein